MQKKDAFEGEKILVLPKKTIKNLGKKSFTKRLYVTDVGYFPKAEHHYREREEGCLEYILIFCTKGSGWIEIDGNKEYLIKNQYAIIPKLASHKYAADRENPWTIYWLHFAGDMTDHFVLPMDYPRILDESVNSRLEDRTHLFEEIYYTLEEGLSDNNLEYSSVLLTHLLGSLKYLSQYRNSKEVYGKDPISKSILYMKDHLREKISVNELAAHCGLSLSHFCLVFKKRTSHTPIEHLTFLRIQKACNFLDFSSLRINEIARKIGYEDAYYFTRVFKKTMGKSPSSYRQSKE